MTRTTETVALARKTKDPFFLALISGACVGSLGEWLLQALLVPCLSNFYIHR